MESSLISSVEISHILHTNVGLVLGLCITKVPNFVNSLIRHVTGELAVMLMCLSVDPLIP